MSSEYQGIAPVEYKVLIQPEVVDDKSAGGMYLPDSVRERQQYAMDRGTVLAYGNGFFQELPGPRPEVGDKVIYSKYAGSVVTMQIDGKRVDCRLVNDKDICAIIREEEDNG